MFTINSHVKFYSRYQPLEKGFGVKVGDDIFGFGSQPIRPQRRVQPTAKFREDLLKNITLGPDLQNIIRQSYDKVMTMTEVMTNHTTDAIYKKSYDKVMINL